MKNLIKVLVLLVGLVALSGCAVRNVEGDPNYIELYPQINSGWYVNAERPYLVVDDSVFIPVVRDDRIVGQWIIGIESGDAIFTISEDNLLYIEGELVGEWYWASSNILMTIAYPQDNFEEATISALRVDFIEDTDDFAQFTEYNDHGISTSYLAVRVDY